MTEIIPMILCLLFTFAAGWFFIDRLFRLMDPVSAAGRKCRVLTNNITILHPMMKFFDPNSCVFLTGRDDEIRTELKKTAVDLAVMENRNGWSDDTNYRMNHLRAFYQPCEPVSRIAGSHVFLLSDGRRNLDIWYSDTMRPVVQKMLISSIITEAGNPL
jgi:hypothetical protein